LPALPDVLASYFNVLPSLFVFLARLHAKFKWLHCGNRLYWNLYGIMDDMTSSFNNYFAMVFTSEDMLDIPMSKFHDLRS